MLLNKTGKARDALQAGSAAGLGLQDRRILILTDGKRSLNDVMAMLGPDILPAIHRLLREGYITGDVPASATARPAALGSAMTGLLRAATEAVQARTEQIRATTAAAAAPAIVVEPADASPVAPQPVTVQTPVAPVSAARSGARRSLAASKMYMLDMLQLQRSADAAELRAVVQCATDPAELVAALLQSLRLILAVSTPTYAERVSNRLAEILPEEALPQLESVRGERSGPVGPPSLSIVA